MTLVKTSRSKEEHGEKPGKTKEKDVGSPTTDGELAETTGGGEQKVIDTHLKNSFETVAYSSMWPQGRSNAEEFKD